MKLMCKNMTHAMKANKLLYNNGIKSRVEKISDNPDVKGCVYCILFEDKYFDEVLKICNNNGILFHKKEKHGSGDINQ